MRYEFILNPVAGNGYSLQAMKKVEGILNTLGAEYQIHETSFPVCGTGFDVTVLECADDKKKKHRGLTPYFLGLLQAIRIFDPVNLQISYDGIRADGEYLICSVANGRYIGGGIPICPDADPADGKLNLVMIRKLPRWKIPFYLPGLMLSRALKFRITNHQLAESVTIRGKGLRFNIDGEIRRMDEACFMIHPRSLLLIC